MRLAILEKGKLFKMSFEMGLPRQVRETWCGKEGPESVVRLLMDASKQYLFLICLKTGEYFQAKITEKELQLFNQFSKGEDALDINRFELFTELLGAGVFGPKFPKLIFDHINDNTSAEAWTNSSRHKCAKVDQVLAFIGVLELILKQTHWGSRVSSDENFADTGTRPLTRAQDFWKGLAALEKVYGWKAKEVNVPDFLREVGWGLMDSEAPEKDWYRTMTLYLNYLQENYPGVVEESCQPRIC